MSDDSYMYRDQMKDLQNANAFIRRNTLGSVLNKLLWLKENGATLDHAIEYVKSEMRS